MEMEEAVSERLKLAMLKKEALKQSLDALSAQSSSLLEVSVRLKVVDANFNSILKMIEKKRDEAVSEFRVRENEVEKRVEKVRVVEKELRDWSGEMSRKERWLEERENRVVEKEDELDERWKGLRLKEARVGRVLRSGIFSEICKEKTRLDEREMGIEMREMKVEEMEMENEERAMRMEEERTRLAKGFDYRMKEMEWRGKRLDRRKNLIDAKVKEVEAKEFNLNEEKEAVKKRAAELEVKEIEMEKKARDMKRVSNYLVDELESERNENKALREEVLLLTQKLESTAKSTGSSVKSTDKENLANRFKCGSVCIKCWYNFGWEESADVH